MAYSDKVLDHYNNPRNVGSLDKSSANVGTGMVGAPECGDVMKLQIKVNDESGIIEDAKFKTFGCGSAIASSSLATEWLKGKTVDEALRNQEHRHRQRTQPAAGEDSLLGARRRRDQGRDQRLRTKQSKQAAGDAGTNGGVMARRMPESLPKFRSRRRPSRRSARRSRRWACRAACGWASWAAVVRA